MQYITRHRSTVEYLGYTFTSVTVDGEAVDPPDTYQLSAPRSGEQPTEWHDGPWLAGPMDPGPYDMYLRFTDNPETPASQVAKVTIT